MQWETKSYPPDGTWCWVSDGQTIWIAMRQAGAGGEWTNDDTWEDWKNEVKYWISLARPDLPRSET